jgi:hypothetical protein
MADLARELRELEVAWPETPDVAGVVAARLAEAGARRRRPTWRPVVAWALAAAVGLFAVVMAASPDARSAVLEWLGLKGVRVERREPRAPAPRPGTLGAGLRLGRPVTLAEARRSGRPVPLAPALGAPDAVYLGARSVSLVYGARPGFTRSPETGAALLVQAFRARVGEYIQKALGSGTRLARLRVDGDPAYFIRGTHGFAFDSGGGSVGFERERLAGNTLLVERADGTLLRIEGAIGQARAVAIARSIGR